MRVGLSIESIDYLGGNEPADFILQALIEAQPMRSSVGGCTTSFEV
jgi:hypothetical protein